MIGNDIVDLSISPISTGARHRRFLNKVFTKQEIELIDNSNHRAVTIWTLWSIKESVYKAIVRKERLIRYAPKSIECIMLNHVDDHSSTASVDYQGQRFSASTKITGACIHTIAVDEPVTMGQVYSASFDLSYSDDPASCLDDELIKALHGSHCQPLVPIEIRRDDLGIPQVYRGEEELALLSLSRHGRYGAFAYALI